VLSQFNPLDLIAVGTEQLVNPDFRSQDTLHEPNGVPRHRQTFGSTATIDVVDLKRPLIRVITTFGAAPTEVFDNRPSPACVR
jgi:hypothetical protein